MKWIWDDKCSKTGAGEVDADEGVLFSFTHKKKKEKKGNGRKKKWQKHEVRK